MNKTDIFDWPIIGHQNISYILKNAIIKQKLVPAYIFVGPDHMGKTTLAEQFICSLQCYSHHCQEKISIKKIPCQECLHCQQYQKKVHPDITLIQKEEEQKNISIEEIRGLQHRLNLHSFLPTYKIALIKNAEALSQEAFNSLLKTLEEPTPQTIIILLTNDLNVIPATVISRCQILRFLPVAKKEIYNHLMSLGGKRNTALYLANLCSGKPGLAIEFSRQPELFDLYQEQARKFLELFTPDINQRFQVLNNFVPRTKSSIEAKDSLNQSINSWVSIIRDLLLIKHDHQELITNTFIKESLKKIADSYSSVKIKNILNNLELTKTYLADNINPKLVLENFIINI